MREAVASVSYARAAGVGGGGKGVDTVLFSAKPPLCTEKLLMPLYERTLNCRGPGKGGVLVVANGGTVTAKGCIFTKNQCGWNNGGAVAHLQSGSRSSADGGKMTVEDCTFDDNGDSRKNAAQHLPS